MTDINKKIKFNEIKNNNTFLNMLHDYYNEGKDELNYLNDVARQIWHTPTELFKPYYGQVLANYIIKESEAKNFEKINIVEVGAGNGTLMINILDHLENTNSKLYNKLINYKIVEISKKLSTTQNNSVLNNSNSNKVQILNKSIFELANLNLVDPQIPTFFIFLEVLDNFAHDVILYDNNKENIMQTNIIVDNFNRYYEEHVPLDDPLIKEYLTLTHQTKETKTNKLRKLINLNKKTKEFVPTKQLEMLKTIKKMFGNSNIKNIKFIINDFSYLDPKNCVSGLNSPCVQTRFGNKMIATQTYLVKPGYFDIFFPTDFNNLELVIQKLFPSIDVNIFGQKQFLLDHSPRDVLLKTQLMSGETPMLEYYQNCKFLVT